MILSVINLFYYNLLLILGLAVEKLWTGDVQSFAFAVKTNKYSPSKVGTFFDKGFKTLSKTIN